MTEKKGPPKQHGTKQWQNCLWMSCMGVTSPEPQGTSKEGLLFGVIFCFVFVCFGVLRKKTNEKPEGECWGLLDNSCISQNTMYPGLPRILRERSICNNSNSAKEENWGKTKELDSKGNFRTLRRCIRFKTEQVSHNDTKQGIPWTWIKVMLNIIKLKGFKMNKPLLLKMLDTHQGI